MRKGVLLLIFTMIFTMIVPVQASTMPQSMLPEKPVSNDINGSYVVSVKVGDEWNKIGSLNFGKNPSTHTIDVGSYLIGDNPIIKLSQNGGGSAYLDAVLLDGMSAIKANYDEGKVLNKLSKEDLDITPVGEEGVVLEFSNCDNNSVITVVGRIEPEVIGKEPLQFPAANNYKSKEEVKDFYSYTLGSNVGTLKIDGILDEVSEMEPFVKDYRVPDSGHPAGDLYFWVMNDDENLYVTLDATPDNTFDGDKDYAKVYVKTDEGIKEFKVSVPENNWGTTGFTYTDKVVYEHKVYEFAIPLNEINTINDEEISIAFVAYGTMAYNENCNNPAIAYDSYNEVYLCVFEHLNPWNTNEQRIIGEFVDKYGQPIGYKFTIASEQFANNDSTFNVSKPSVAFNSETDEFLVTWVDNNTSNYVCAKKVKYDSNTNYEPFIVSSNDQASQNVETPKVAYDSDNNKFLIVWVDSNDVDGESINGQYINADGSKEGSLLIIKEKANLDLKNTSVAFGDMLDSFLVTWEYSNNIEARVISSTGSPLKSPLTSPITPIGAGKNPNVSYNNNIHSFSIIWDNNGIKGHHYRYNYILDTSVTLKSVSDEINIPSPDANNYNIAYPSAYYSEYYRQLLCLWSSYNTTECYAKLCTIGYEGNAGNPFYTDALIENCDSIDLNKLSMAISGDDEYQNLIAYVIEDSNDIGYRIIGDVPEEPSLIACLNPDIAYDINSELYLSVFEYSLTDYDYHSLSSYIYGEIINRNGDVVGEKFPIYNGNEFKFNYEPTVAYDAENKNFLVVWSSRYGESENNNILVARTVTIDETNEEIPCDFGDVFFISGNDFDDMIIQEVEPDLDYGSEGEFLLVWNQHSNDNMDIYGRIVDSANNLDNNNFIISNDSSNSRNSSNPNVCYNPTYDAFLVAWSYYNDDSIVVIDAQVVNSLGKLSDNETVNIGGNWCYYPNISFNNSNDQFLITWQDFSYDVVRLVKGQYVSLDTELAPKKIANEFNITPDDDYYHGIYPASYGDGYGKMLCAWSSTLLEDNRYYPRLQYIDNEGYHQGGAFYPNDYDGDYTTDNLTSSSQIAMSGDNLGKVIIAYDYEPAYYKMSSNSFDYELNINYLIFGEVNIEPYIEFSNAPFDEIIVGDTFQSIIKLYNNEYPTGTEINENLYYYCDNELIATIGNTGLITGINEGKTFVTAVYDPFATIEDDIVSFSDGMITVKNPTTVTVIPKPLPSLEFDKETYKIQINKTELFSVILKNHGDIEEQPVTDIVTYELGNPEIASISTRGAITGLAVGSTTVSAIYTDGEIELTAFANIVVDIAPPPSSGSSTPVRTHIGQILIDNKVIKTLYEEDVINKNNTYTFIADKVGETAKLWLDSGFYNDLAEDYPNRIIKFNWDKGTYTLPLNCDEVLKEIDSSAKKVNILIEKIDDKEIIEAAKDSAINMGAEIISDLIDFSVYVEKSKGNTDIESLDFYAVRTINELDNINENISTSMKFVENKESLTFAPSVFDDDFVTIKYRGNGIFTTIENPQTFNDISSHWAKVNIEKLATRNIAFGRENNSFAPNDFITRAEFAVMITRALGITEEEGSNDFSDVSDEWFAEDISTAFESGLINGRNDGKFYPNEKIQRKDMAVMIQNALEFAGMSFDVSSADSVLSMFKDSTSIADYARESTAFCANAGIIMGRDTKNFDPDQNATRAEASAIIERMLRYLDFMN